MNLEARIERALGRRPCSLSRLAGGCVGDVRLAEFSTGEPLVVKSGGESLVVEADMLRFLAEHSALPVPRVIHAEPAMLILEFVPNNGTIAARASEQVHAGQLLAALHAVRPTGMSAHRHGFGRETLIAGLEQRNEWCDSWVEFFAERRLIAMARETVRAGMAPEQFVVRLERFARDALPTLIDEPDAPSLLHGDAWSGNILVREGRVAAFIDPAVYFGHAEIELAFGTLFGTFTDAFFEAYSAIRPIKAGFVEVRREVYNLYPLLVHARLFGGGYLAQVDATLRRFGA